MKDNHLKFFYGLKKTTIKNPMQKEVTYNSDINECKMIYTADNSYHTSFYVDEIKSSTESTPTQSSDFFDWISFLEKKANEAFDRKRKEVSNYHIIKDLKNEVLCKYDENKYRYLDSFLDEAEKDLQVSLPSLFNSIRFIYEIPSDIIDKSFFFIDQDSSYVNMALVNSESRLDLTFKDNGEVSFRFVDCDGGRIRITGTSFFGVGKNQKETRKINKLMNLAKREF